jgi:hypothetical protein
LNPATRVRIPVGPDIQNSLLFLFQKDLQFFFPIPRVAKKLPLARKMARKLASLFVSWQEKLQVFLKQK